MKWTIALLALFVASPTQASGDSSPASNDRHFILLNYGAFGRFSNSYEVFPDHNAVAIETVEDADQRGAIVRYFNGHLSAAAFDEGFSRLTPFLISDAPRGSCVDTPPDGPESELRFGATLEHREIFPFNCADATQKKFFDDRMLAMNWRLERLVKDRCPFRMLKVSYNPPGMAPDTKPITPLPPCPAK